LRIIYLISAISLLLLTQLAVGEPGQTTLTGDDAFSRANEAYRGGDWAGAEALYEQVLGTGSRLPLWSTTWPTLACGRTSWGRRFSTTRGHGG